MTDICIQSNAHIKDGLWAHRYQLVDVGLEADVGVGQKCANGPHQRAERVKVFQ